MTYKDKRESGEKHTERVACPLCGWWRTITPGYGIDQRTGEPREVRFDKVDVETATLWRVERLSGAGRASKNARIDLMDSRKLRELPAEMKEQIKIQCQKILEVLSNEGSDAATRAGKPRKAGRKKAAETD